MRLYLDISAVLASRRASSYSTRLFEVARACENKCGIYVIANSV